MKNNSKAIMNEERIIEKVNLPDIGLPISPFSNGIEFDIKFPQFKKPTNETYCYKFSTPIQLANSSQTIPIAYTFKFRHPLNVQNHPRTLNENTTVESSSENIKNNKTKSYPGDTDNNGQCTGCFIENNKVSKCNINDYKKISVSDFFGKRSKLSNNHWVYNSFFPNNTILNIGSSEGKKDPVPIFNSSSGTISPKKSKSNKIQWTCSIIKPAAEKSKLNEKHRAGLVSQEIASTVPLREGFNLNASNIESIFDSNKGSSLNFTEQEV